MARTIPTNTHDPDAIDFVSPEVVEMRKDWKLVEALLGGTRKMRDGREDWLPREDGESVKQYDARLARTYLFPAFCDQVKRMVAKPFSRPVELRGGELPRELESIEESTDGSGKTLTATIADVALDAIAYGVSHVLVDFPSETGETLGPIVRGEARPIWRHLKATQVLGWRSATEGGRTVLDEIRFRDDRVEPKGAFGSEEVAYIVHLTREFAQRYAWAGDRGWLPVEDPRPYSFQVDGRSRIPLATVYTDQTDFMEAKPPMMGIADLNLAHWQSTADQRNVVHFVRVPVMVITGLSDPQDEQRQIVVSSAKALKFRGTDTKVGYAEHSGRGAEAGQRDLEMLEDQMEVLGLQPNVRKTVQATATSQRVKEGRTTTQAQEWLRRLEALALDCYEFSAAWTGSALPADFEVDVFSDFAVDPGDASHVEALLKARIEGEIPRSVFLEELKRRAVLAETVDPEEVERELEEEREEALAALPAAPDAIPEPPAGPGDDRRATPPAAAPGAA